ncbi:MAG: aspartate carbamoyltransferase regulatory subunit [Nitrososphaerota archaeon]
MSKELKDEESLIVRRIKEGTVIDHITAGRALRVLEILGIRGEADNVVTVAINVPSHKLGKKDIVKIEGRFLSADETNKIALIAPHATINIIRGYRVVQKRKVELPKEFVNVFRCPYPTCVSNSAAEPIVPILVVVSADRPQLRCFYCSRIIEVEDIIRQIV